jgi:hypothetical protein
MKTGNVKDYRVLTPLKFPVETLPICNLVKTEHVRHSPLCSPTSKALRYVRFNKNEVSTSLGPSFSIRWDAWLPNKPYPFGKILRELKIVHDPCIQCIDKGSHIGFLVRHQKMWLYSRVRLNPVRQDQSSVVAKGSPRLEGYVANSYQVVDSCGIQYLTSTISRVGDMSQVPQV